MGTRLPALLAVLLLLGVAAFADDAGQCDRSLFGGGTLLQRLDMQRTADPSWTTAWVDQSGWEIWSFCQPDFPMYEVGKLWPVKAGKNNCLLLGGYVSFWDETDDWFLEPYWVYTYSIGEKLRLETAGGVYVPLGDGPWVLYTNQVAASYPVARNIRAGVAATNWWQEGCENSIGVGPKLEISSGHTNWLLRYTWGVSGGAPDIARVEFSIKFD